jgi:hypothetical protein
MLKTSYWVIALAALWIAGFGAEAALPNKCVVNGKVTYQQQACPSERGAPRPTVQELNAREKQRRAAAAASAAAAATPASTPDASAPDASAGPVGFRCDGRQRCNQMTSCAEAKFFLASCPGVKMDGDRDGSPCEQQWCHR